MQLQDSQQRHEYQINSFDNYLPHSYSKPNPTQKWHRGNNPKNKKVRTSLLRST